MTHPAVPRRLDAHSPRTREQRRADVADRLLESLENLVHRHRALNVDAEIVAAEVAGSVSDRALMDALYSGAARLTDQVEDHMSPPLPTIGSTEDARDAVALLETSDAVLVQEDGKPVGVLTRQDLLGYLARG